MLTGDSVCLSSAGSESILWVGAPKTRIKEHTVSFHSLILCLVFLIAAVAYAADEPKKEPAKAVADQIAAIKKEHQEREKKFYSDLRTFRDDDKKISDLNTENSKSVREQAKELTSLIKAHGKEPVAFEGILVLVGELRYPLDDEMVQLVLKHHLSNAKMGHLCFDLRYRSRESWVRKLLEEASTKHPQKGVRGQALYALGDYHRYSAQPWGEKLPEAEEAKMWAEAAKYFTEVTKGYADIMTPDGKAKLGDKAASELTRIKNVPNLKIGKMAPEIVGEDIDGKKVKLSDYRGKVVLLDFWGHW
jgi:hypothetical protein